MPVNTVKSICILLVLSILLTGVCHASLLDFMDRSCAAVNIARKAGFTKEYVEAGGFRILTYRRFSGPSEKIRIYIEGDGRAWEAVGRLSDDPTPSNPVALQLAAADPSDNVAYIARPGQFPDTDTPGCDPTYWSQRRFAPEVVGSLDKIVDILKKGSSAKHVELVGYSGGGALAVLVAAQRNDIITLRTVAGNLDPKALCDYHKVSRLDGSMDPLDVAQKVARIPQRHFVGEKDRVIPRSIAEAFIKKEGSRTDSRITVVKRATHAAGWRERWPELLSIPLD